MRYKNVWIIKILAKYKFDSYEYAKNIKEDTLIITSNDDEVISSELSKKLSNQFENLYKIVVFDGIKHDNYYLYDSVQEEIKEYLESRLK